MYPDELLYMLDKAINNTKINEDSKNPRLLQAINAKKKHSHHVDPDKVSLFNDPKVRSGKEWAKYGGNFPVERNGHVYYVSRSIAVSLYTYCKNVNGEWCILANQRGQGAQNAKGLWNVPCGYLDYNETTNYAAKRETWEETGVNVPISKIHMMGMNSGQLETDDDIANHKLSPAYGKQDVTIRFSAVLDGTTDNYPVSDANCEPGEVSDIQWIPLSKAKSYPWAYGQGDKVLSQARTSLGDYTNPNANNSVEDKIRQLKMILRSNPSANTLFDSIIKELTTQLPINEGWAKNALGAAAIGAATMFGGNANAQTIDNDSINTNYPNTEYVDTVQTYNKYDNGLHDDAYWEETEDAFIHHPSTRKYEYPVDSLKQWFPKAYRDRNADPSVWKSPKNASAYHSVVPMPHSGKIVLINKGGDGQNPWLSVLKNYNRAEYNRVIKSQKGQK